RGPASRSTRAPLVPPGEGPAGSTGRMGDSASDRDSSSGGSSSRIASFSPVFIGQDHFAAFDHRVDVIDPEGVLQAHVVGNIKQNEVRLFPFLDAADLAPPPDGVGRVDGGGGEDL